MVEQTPQDVRDFWIDEVGPKGWYRQDDALDTEIRDRFGALWQAALDRRICCWCSNPENVLSYLIVTDQFPRNMFRGQAHAFATDKIARKVAHAAVIRGWDKAVAVPERQFFYMPFMHSEYIADQNRSVRLFAARMPEARDNLDHAIAHREVIRRFGRFPYRNDALGRVNTPEEEHFLNGGGYGAILKDRAA